MFGTCNLDLTDISLLRFPLTAVSIGVLILLGLLPGVSSFRLPPTLSERLFLGSCGCASSLKLPEVLLLEVFNLKLPGESLQLPDDPFLLSGRRADRRSSQDPVGVLSFRGLISWPSGVAARLLLLLLNTLLWSTPAHLS